MKASSRLSLQVMAAVLLLAMAMGVSAAERWVTSGTGGRVTNSYEDCVRALDGSTLICQNDSDGDGVTDDLDKCPDTPKGVQVDAEGCPLDTDGDGVPDYQDKCPQTPKGAIVDEVGCMKQLILNNVEFEVDSTILKPGAQTSLNQVADALRGRPDVNKMSVIGHTDSTGSNAYNLKLSKRRAAAVVDYLKQAGVHINLVYSGSGESQPVADNSTEEGRAMNRRVELNVIK
ncbi:MAG: OmpA family protein [Gammaproteobacteria bacterium]|nr:OmpA family protein [Gammaproteobacteria bacterium]